MSVSNKFTFLVGSIIVPFALFWASQKLDQSSKSLTGNVITQTSLHPKGMAKTTDLSIVVDGHKIETPYLTSIEILNSGSKPLSPDDYESAIELKADPETKIIKAESQSINPSDLQITISAEGNVLRIKPLLLNAGDNFVVTMLTSGKVPEWKGRARIAGVSSFQLNAIVKKKPAYRTAIFLMVIIVLMSYSFHIVSDSMAARRPAKKFEPFIVTGSIILASSSLMSTFLRSLGDYDWWLGALVFMGTILLTGGLKLMLDNYSRDKSKT